MHHTVLDEKSGVPRQRQLRVRKRCVRSNIRRRCRRGRGCRRVRETAGARSPPPAVATRAAAAPRAVWVETAQACKIIPINN